jgi:hypothetical protein
MSDPILRSQTCPESLMPISARSMLKIAEQHGWMTNCTVAIGPADDEQLAVMSVVVRCMHPERRQSVAARWECPSDRSRPFSFATAWTHPGPVGLPFRLNFSEAKAALL